MSESLPLKFGFQVQVANAALATGLDFAFSHFSTLCCGLAKIAAESLRGKNRNRGSNPCHNPDSSAMEFGSWRRGSG